MEQNATEHSVTVRAVAECLRGLGQVVVTATATDMAVLRALGDVLVFAGDDRHPLAVALQKMPTAADVGAKDMAIREAFFIELNSRERHCASCGCEWTGSDADCPQCADDYRREYMGE